jgi:endonuclease G
LTDDRTQARVTHNDYTNAGYDRGHMAPSHNVGSRYGCTAQNETYRMSNIAPQLAVLNQRPWGGLENLERNFATSFSQVWVMTGPIFDPVWLNRLCSGIEIPTAFYKIIVRETNGNPDVLAVIFDQDTKPGVRLSTLAKTVREIEQRTGINFLAELPDVLESAIETTPATDAAWQLDSALDQMHSGPTADVSPFHERITHGSSHLSMLLGKKGQQGAVVLDLLRQEWRGNRTKQRKLR